MFVALDIAFYLTELGGERNTSGFTLVSTLSNIIFLVFRTVRAKEIKIDSKVISFKVRVNPDPNITLQLREQDSYTEHCVPNEDVMKYKPVRMTFFHYDKSTSKRKLLWHDGDAKTGVSLHKFISNGRFIAEMLFSNPKFSKLSFLLPRLMFVAV